MTPIGAPGIFSSAPVIFNPITKINWTYAYWAEGPDFVASSPSDGAEVYTWHDEIGAVNLTGYPAESPVYRASGINSKPSLEFAGGNDYLFNTSVAMTEPWSIVAIAKFDNPGTSVYTLLNTASFGPSMVSSSGKWATGFNDTGDTDDANPHIHTLYYSNGSSDVYDLDGTTILGPTGFTSTGTVGDLYVGSAVTGTTAQNPWDGHIVFIGLYDSGDVRSHAEWANFKQWAAAHYGITVA